VIEVIFSQIRSEIQLNILRSRKSIRVAVAWFTSKELLGQLTDQLSIGCKVEIIISDHAENKRLTFDKFIINGGIVHVLPTSNSKFLHEKFALFDNDRLIVGSYNWTNSAEFYNHESVIHSDDAVLINAFTNRFDALKQLVTGYDRARLNGLDSLPADTKEAEYATLEKELQNDFFDTIKKAPALGARINSDRVIKFITNYGAVGGANRLIKEGTDKIHWGLLELGAINRLDISFENIILKDKYKHLFSEAIQKKAQERLDKFSK
jgi:hypothetical protein